MKASTNGQSGTTRSPRARASSSAPVTSAVPRPRRWMPGSTSVCRNATTSRRARGRRARQHARRRPAARSGAVGTAHHGDLVLGQTAEATRRVQIGRRRREDRYRPPMTGGARAPTFLLSTTKKEKEMSTTTTTRRLASPRGSPVRALWRSAVPGGGGCVAKPAPTAPGDPLDPRTYAPESKAVPRAPRDRRPEVHVPGERHLALHRPRGDALQAERRAEGRRHALPQLRDRAAGVAVQGRKLRRGGADGDRAGRGRRTSRGSC